MPDDPFTLSAYAGHLRQAQRSGYGFISFGDLDDGDGAPEQPSILLRHDIDYSPRWAGRMAAVEAENGVRATYFFQLGSPYYSIADKGTERFVDEILGAGHWLGLHFDATEIGSDPEVAERAGTEAAELADCTQATVGAVSFHMPGRRPVGHLELPDGLVNTYAPRFFDEVGYISDSNMNWRGQDLARSLASREHHLLQLLIHPFWWQDAYAPMLEKLETLAAELGIEVSELVTREQRELLRERS